MSSERLGDRSRPPRPTDEPAPTPARQDRQGSQRKKGQDRAPTEHKEEKKVRALSPTDIGPPMPQSSYRELKKEAFAKYHPAKSGPIAGGVGRGGRGQPNMGARMGALLEKIKRDRTN